MNKHERQDPAVKAIEQSIIEDIEPWSDIDEFFDSIRNCARAIGAPEGAPASEFYAAVYRD